MAMPLSDTFGEGEQAASSTRRLLEVMDDTLPCELPELACQLRERISSPSSFSIANTVSLIDR